MQLRVVEVSVKKCCLLAPMLMCGVDATGDGHCEVTRWSTY